MLPSFHPNSYPRMANMPVEAFRETDEPLPDPAKIYPPGVVAISYFFGPPMSLDPRYAEITAQKRKEQDTMPITYINEHGFEVPIPELSPEEFEVPNLIILIGKQVFFNYFLLQFVVFSPAQITDSR